MRYCPYCTHELARQNVDGRVRLVCPSCRTILYRDPKLAAAVLVESDGRLLLVQRGVEPQRGDWCLPAGFVEEDESPREAAIRECCEETGLEIEIGDLLDVISFDDRARRKKGALVLYSAHLVGGRLTPGDDASDAALFAPEELPSNIAFDGHRQAIQAWQAQRPRPD